MFSVVYIKIMLRLNTTIQNKVHRHTSQLNNDNKVKGMISLILNEVLTILNTSWFKQKQL